MAAPKKPNTAAANAAQRRKGDEKAAQRLQEAGYGIIHPAAGDKIWPGCRVRAWVAVEGYVSSVKDDGMLVIEYGASPDREPHYVLVERRYVTERK